MEIAESIDYDLTVGGRLGLLAVCAAVVLTVAAGEGSARRAAGGTGSDTVLSTKDVTIAAGQTGDATTLCPAGMRAFAGGAGATTANPPAHQLQMTIGVRADGVPPTGRDGSEVVQGWKASVYNYGSASATFRVYALCSANSDALTGPPLIYAQDATHLMGGNATCATGRVVTGGGIANLDGPLSPPPAYVTTSGPNGDGVTWQAAALQFVQGARDYEALPICSKAVDYTLVHGVGTLPGTGKSTTTVACPQGFRAVGGGARISDAGLGAAIDDSAPTGRDGTVPNGQQPAYGWTATAANVRGTADTLTVYAFCVAEAASAQPPPPGSTAPAISAAHLAPTAFRAAKAGSNTSNAAATGTTVSYQDSMASSTTVTVLQQAPGHLRGGKCLAGGAGKPCTRASTVGSFVQDDTAGPDQFHFSGRISGQALAPGSYLLALTPHANGHAGATVRLAFRIAS